MSGIAGFCDFTRDNTAHRWLGVGERMGRASSPGGELWACPAGILTGEQTLERPLGTARYAITWTGELRNAPALRKILRAQGYRLTTQEDAEAALYGYMEYGTALGEKLDGGYALVVWDGLKGQFVAMRDKQGEKELFYVNHGETRVFSSSPAALENYPTREKGTAKLLPPGEVAVWGKETGTV